MERGKKWVAQVEEQETCGWFRRWSEGMTRAGGGGAREKWVVESGVVVERRRDWS